MQVADRKLLRITQDKVHARSTLEARGRVLLVVPQDLKLKRSIFSACCGVWRINLGVPLHWIRPLEHWNRVWICTGLMTAASAGR